MTDSTETKLDGRTREAKQAAASDAVAPSKRRRRASVGGLTLKLDAPQRPGYVRRWFNGDPTRLYEAEQLGYDFVQDPAGTDEKRTDGMGSRISRFAGRDQNGGGVQTYLMECTVEDYEQGQRDKEARLKTFDDTLNAGNDPTGELSKAEQYDVGSKISRTG